MLHENCSNCTVLGHPLLMFTIAVNGHGPIPMEACRSLCEKHGIGAQGKQNTVTSKCSFGCCKAHK
jgi:hypothetical protein